jgi:peptide/nickel transport system substrate-binding protein
MSTAMTRDSSSELLAQRVSRRRLLRDVAVATAATGALGLQQAGAAPIGSSAPARARRQEGRYGGSAIYLAGQEGAHILPISSLSTVITPTVPFFNGLTRPGLQREPTPDLASNWDVSEDGLTYTFHLRNDVTFHDGAPFTANDVKFTWEVIAHPDNTTSAQIYSFFSVVSGAPEYKAGTATEVTGIKVVDDYTLEVTLTTPSAPFLTIGTGQYILPQHLLKDIPVASLLETDFARAPIGTGPFKFTAWNAGDSIIGTAFEEHFAGRPFLDQIVIRVVALDPNSLVTAFKSGEIHVGGTTFESHAALQGDESVTPIEREGQWNQYIEFNLIKPIFQDLNVRKALSFGLNRQEISDFAFEGRAQIYNSVFPYSWWPTKTDTTLYDNDIEQAKALLDAAGWVEGSDGIREKDGEKFSFTFHVFDQIWWQIVQQQWKAIGVDAKLEVVDWPTMSTQFYLTHTFDAVGLHVPYSLYTDPHYALPGYFLSANNRNSYNNPRSDELILAAAATTDQEQRQALYYEWQEVIAQDIPHLWLGNPPMSDAYASKLVVPDRSSLHFVWREVEDWYWAE